MSSNKASKPGERIGRLRRELEEATAELVAAIVVGEPEQRMHTTYIYKLIAATPEVSWTSEQICDALSPRAPVLLKTVASTLCRLHKRGEIARVEYGCYQAVSRYKAVDLTTAEPKPNDIPPENMSPVMARSRLFD